MLIANHKYRAPGKEAKLLSTLAGGRPRIAAKNSNGKTTLRSLRTTTAWALCGILLSVILFSCVNREKARQEIAADEFVAAEKELVTEIDKAIHHIPPPSKIPILIQKTGAGFYPTVVNDSGLLNYYLTSNDKSALNLGIFAVDAGYLATYHKVEEALNNIKGCQKLADKIGGGSSFDADLLLSFEKNIDNSDSLASAIDKTLKIVEQKLEAHDRLTMMALVMAGAYIEGLYISTQVIQQYPHDAPAGGASLKPLIRVVLQQKTSLIDFISVLRHLERTNITSHLVSEMNVLHYQFEALADLEETLQSTQESVPTQQHQLRDITNEIKRIRRDIIN